MRFAGYKTRRHALAVHKKTMRRRTYRKVLKAIFTPAQMRQGRHASAYQEARRSTWAKSFGRVSPIASAIYNLLVGRAKAKEHAKP